MFGYNVTFHPLYNVKCVETIHIFRCKITEQMFPQLLGILVSRPRKGNSMYKLSRCHTKRSECMENAKVKYSRFHNFGSVTYNSSVPW